MYGRGGGRRGAGLVDGNGVCMADESYGCLLRVR